MGPDHLGLVEQRQFAGLFQDALDHEHDIRTAGIVLIKAQRGIGLQAVGQDAFAEFGNLLAILEHDGVFADEVDAAHVAVEIDADTGPVEPGRHLLDVGRFAGTVIALDHDAAVVLEAGQDGERHLLAEHIVVVDVGDVIVTVDTLSAT